MSAPLHRIAIAGETYSSNLGDGVIADSLAFLFQKASPGTETTHVDISGHSGWRDSSGAHLPGEPEGASGRSPGRLDTIGRWYLVRRARCRRVWRDPLDQATALIIGGGQLLMDNHLDFPLKIHAVVTEAAARGLPIHFVACGVNPDWSPWAARLFRESLTRARTVSVRDDASAVALKHLVPEIDPQIMVDPAIWAADVYGRDASGRRRSVGLGVISPAAVNRRRRTTLSADHLINLWQGVIRLIVAEGSEFEIFTNGSQDDFAMACLLAEKTSARLGIECPVAPRPVRPTELARRIGGYEKVIAARLHASIIAASYGITAIGLSWDKKVDAFYRVLNRPAASIDLATAEPEQVMDLMRAATADIDWVAIEKCRGSALEGVARVIAEPA